MQYSHNKVLSKSALCLLIAFFSVLQSVHAQLELLPKTLEVADEEYYADVQQLSELLYSDPQAALDNGFDLIKEYAGANDPLEAIVFYITYRAASRLEQYGLMLKLLPILKKLGDSYDIDYGMYSAFYDLQSADIHYRLGDYHQAIDGYRKSLRLIEEDYVLTASVTNNIGLAYQQLKQQDSAKYYFSRAIKIIDTSTDQESHYRGSYPQYFRKVIQANKIPFLLEEDRYNDALKFSNQELAAAKEQRDKPIILSAYRDQAQIYYGLNKVDKARHYTDSIFMALGSGKNSKLEGDAYHLQSLISAATGNVREATRLSRKYRNKLDSISMIQQKRILYNQVYLSDIKKWQQRTDEVSMDLLNVTDIKNNYRVGFWIVIVIILLTSVLWLSNRKRRRGLAIKNVQIQKLFEENALLLNEMHHRIKNNLQTISSMLYMSADKHKGSAIESELKRVVLQVESVGKIHDLLRKQESGTQVNLQHYLKSLVNTHLLNYSKQNIETMVDVVDKVVTVEFALPLGLILSELINNSLKHAFKNGKKKITVKIQELDKSVLSFYYSDHQNAMNAQNLTKNDVEIHGTDLIDLLIKELKAKRLNNTAHDFDLYLEIPQKL